MKKHDKDESESVSPESEVSGTAEAGSRAKLCEVALKLFAEKGLDGVSTRDIAGGAGVNISLISYYFGGKEGLYKEVLLNFAREAQNQLTQVFSSYDESKLDRASYVLLMKNLIRTMVTFKGRNQDMSVLMMREMLEGMPHAREVHETVFDSMVRKVVGLMQAAQSKKIIRADLDPYLLFFSLIHSADCQFMGQRCPMPLTQHCGEMSLDQIVDQLTKIFIEGVLV